MNYENVKCQYGLNANMLFLENSEDAELQMQMSNWASN